MIIYKGSPIRLLDNFSTETLQARRVWHDIFKWWKERTHHQEYSTQQDSHSDFLSLFFKSIYFNWRLITLQYCSGFCHTLTWISHGCTCVPPSQTPLPPPSPSHPSGLSQWTSFEGPVSCIELGLVIYFTYGNIFVSNHPTLSFSHRVERSVLYIYVSFAVLHIGVSLPSLKIPYICV